MMKYHDYVSQYAVDLFLGPVTDRASVSDDKDRYYTCSGLKAIESDCVSVYSVHCRVIADNRSEFELQKIFEKK